jgi:gliding motility-associated-like protein
MKTLLSLFFTISIVILNAQSTCQTAQPFCAGGVSGVTYPASVNSGAAQSGPNYGCLITQPNPAWYYLQVSNPGNLIIQIQGQSNTFPFGPGQDVDFICWGPFSSLSGICSSLTAGNTVDCSYSGSFTETLTIPTGLTGEYYLVLITNFANVSQNILFSQIGGTGNTNCSLVNTNTTICIGSSITLTTNPPVGLTNINYILQPGNIISSTPLFTATPIINSTYSILASGVNSQNISQTQTAVINVTVNPSPAFSPTITNSTCTSSLNSFSLGLSINPPNANPNYTITWNIIPYGVSNATQVSASGGINSGIYSASITLAGGCKSNTTFTINPTPATANFTISPPSNVYSITCYNPTLNLTASNANNSYTWSSLSNAAINSASANINFTGTGTWTIQAINMTSSCVATKTIQVVQNTLSPVSTLSPSFQTITCANTNVLPVTIVSNLTVNIINQIYSPQGGTVSSGNPTLSITPGPGIYTNCVTNALNGCSTCKQFTIATLGGFPDFNLASPQNFTLGCSSKSTAIVNIINANSNPPGVSLTFTALAPGASSVLTGSLSNTNSYTISTPGTWTFVTRDNVTQCLTRVPISILQNIFAPSFDSLVIPQTILDCKKTKMVLECFSSNVNTEFNWQFKNGSLTSNYATYSIEINTNTLTPNTILISNYTLTLKDNVNLCTNSTVIPIYQNIFPPKAIINPGSTPSISCITSSVVLTNGSSSGIPNGIGFVNSQPAVAYDWDAPSPQTRMQLSSSYVAYLPGNYTLTAYDLNNGCLAKTSINVGDDRVYPAINFSPTPIAILDCGAKSASMTIVPSTGQTNLEYTWVPPANAIFSGSINDKVFRSSSLGIYRVVVKDTKNGCAGSGLVIMKSGTLTTEIEPDKLQGYAPLGVTFKNNSFSTLDTSNIKTIWNFGNGNTANTGSAGKSPYALFTLPGNYTVTAYIQKGECLGSVSKVINVEIPSQLTIPNIFTPNGDNINDQFFLKANSLGVITFSIFDRWGHLIFDTKSETGNIIWDGKNQAGKIVADGTYFYILNAEGTDGNKFKETGTITVLK